MITKISYLIKNFVLRVRYRSRLTVQGIVHIKKNVYFNIDLESRVILGDRSSFHIGNHLSAVAGGEIQIGSSCSFNRYCILVGREKIHIGNHCIIGPNVLIYDHDHKYSANGVTNDYNTGSIVIEDGCWIGGNVTILRNTHIGEGSVIGAGCVIRGNIPAHSIVTGGRELKIHPIE